MKRKLSIKKSFGGILLPEGLLKLLPSMDAAQIKTFILLSSCNGALPDDAAASLGIDEAELDAAIAFCRGTGYFVTDNVPAPQPRAAQFQSYDSETLSVAMQESDFAMLIKEMGQILGKIINKNDINMLFNLYDYEGLSPEYICAVANYAVRRSKGTMSYIVRTALSIHDEGIVCYDELERYISRRERNENSKYRIWHAMGFGDRAPSSKERAFLTKWFDEYAMTEELVKAAYEITVDAIGTPKLSYMAKILDDCFANGYTTPEQCIAARSSTKATAKNEKSSFDLDEFYTTAVKKGMEDT